MDNIFDYKMETLGQKEREKLQTKLLKKMLKKLGASKFYRRKLKDYYIEKIEDISTLPFTTKTELRKLGPYDNLSTPISKILEFHASSGTTGVPIGSFFTAYDLERTKRVLARTWYMQNVRKTEIVQHLASYGLFSAGLLNHYALLYIGAFVIPIGTVETKKQLDYMKRFRSTIVTGIASHYLRLIYFMEHEGYKKSDFRLKTAIAAGEPYSENMREYIGERLGVEVFDQYGLAEINTGIAGECKYRCGLHIQSDYAYPEIINPKTLEILGEGEEGELVLTSLDKEASNLIRYRTGDITSIMYEKCDCGRTTPRLSRFKGRLDDIIFFKGIKLEPNLIDKNLWKMKDIIDPKTWRLEISREEGLDRGTIYIQRNPNVKADIGNIERELLSNVGVKFRVVLEPKRPPDEMHKIKRVIDLRKEK